MKATSNYSFPFLKVVLASVLSFFLFSIDVVDVTHRKSVHNVGDSVDRAAQTQGSLILTRFSGLLHRGDARKTSGKNLRDIRGRSLQDLVPLDRRDRSRQG